MRAIVRAAALITTLIFAPSARAEESATLVSPNGRVEIRFALAGETPTYEVRFADHQVLAPSPLGLALRDVSWAGLRLIEQSRASADLRYRLVAGKTAAARNTYNEATFALQAANGRRLDLVFRAYDDGAAFRYVLPAQQGLQDIAISGERTRFYFPTDYSCWGFNVGHFGSNHEGEFDPVRASLIRPSNMFDMPLVCTGADFAFAIAEADLQNYAGLYLAGRGDGGLGLEAKLSPRLDDPSIAVRLTASSSSVVSPWRVVMLAETAGQLIESTLIANLNPHPRLTHRGCAQAALRGIGGQVREPAFPIPGMNTETIRAYIDFAAANGVEYMLVDDGWFVGANAWTPRPDADITRPIPELDLPALIAYARARHVGVWLWVHWRLINARMDEALATYQRWGIAGVKVDYMDRDDQEMVEFYHRLMRTAAAHHLMVDLHGAYPPRGLARTYPNFLTQEGVLGAEYNKWSRRITARHNVMLAYTRMLLGPMDYTPGGMRNTTPEAFEPHFIRPQVMTTRAHGLAMYVVYESPFASLADSPDSYEGQAGMDFLRAVPTTWDATRFIGGDIGEYVAVARKRGRDWYIGVMNNENARDVSLPLDFLQGGSYRAEIWADGATPVDIAKSETRPSATSGPLRLHLAANGGAVVRLRR